MNYTRLKTLLFQKLESKTSWGRNELKEVINDAFLEAADMDIDERMQQQPEVPCATYYDGDEFGVSNYEETPLGDSHEAQRSEVP
jgi:hypothetical protein